ncbi:molybdate ABC transporter permease subunit [Bacillus sp. 1P10SD]|uniref:molybdate ABC transporter permease subunit n=1 Tax=Bacillus sp. 1P10SD TaxID=3132265 RepID=UPI0039A6787A
MTLFHDEFWTPIVLSIKVAASSITIVFFLGILLGRLFARKQFKGKILLETFLLLPIVLPPTVIGFLLIYLFGINSPFGIILEKIFAQPIIFTPTAAVIASTVVAFPLMYQTVKIGFQAVDRGIEEAARVDGAGEIKVFLYITLPLSIKSIFAGLILSFARALGEFGATFMFAGNIPGKTQTAPTAIYIAMESGNMNLAWFLVATMVFISFSFLLLTTITQK